MQQLVSMRSPVLFISFWLIYTAFSFIISKSLLKKGVAVNTVTCSVIMFIYMIMKYFPEINPIIGILTILTAVIISVIVSKKKIFHTLGSIAIVIVLILLSATLMALIELLILGDKYEGMYTGLPVDADYLFMAVFGILGFISFALLWAGIIKLVIAKKQKLLDYSAKYLFFLWVPMTHLFAFGILLYMINSVTSYSYNFSVVSCIYATITSVLDFITFIVVDVYENIEQENKLFEKQLLQNKLDYQQTVLLNQGKIELRKMKHDMLNILSTAKGFIEIGNDEKALGILKNATNDLMSINGIQICSNEVLNTMLSIKKEHASEEGVDLEFNINEDAGIHVDDYTLCRLIGNLADNQINAAKHSEIKNAQMRINIEDRSLTIITENRFNPEEKKAVYTDGRHGNGRNIIRELAKSYSGKYSYEINGNIYKSVTTLNNMKSNKASTPPHNLA